MSGRVACAGVALLLLALSPSAAASPRTVQQAEELLAELRYDEAQSTLEAGLEDGDNDRASLAAIYLMLGEIAASSGERDEARALFRNALALIPDLTLSKGASPKLVEPFDAARAALERADPIGGARQLEGRRLSIQVSSDPVNMVVGAVARVRVGGKNRVLRGEGRERVEIEIPEGAEIREVALVDRHGNAVAVVEDQPGELASTAAAQLSTAPPTDETDEEADGPGLVGRWELWGGLGVAAAAAGAFASWRANEKVDQIEALDDGTDFSVALELEDQARRRILYANIAFAAAGACLITGAVLYWRSRDEDSSADSARRTAIVAPTAGPASVGVAATLRF